MIANGFDNIENSFIIQTIFLSNIGAICTVKPIVEKERASSFDLVGPI